MRFSKMEKETVTIDKERYEELLDKENLLDALDAAGVDNWDGYDFAMEQYQEDSA